MRHGFAFKQDAARTPAPHRRSIDIIEQSLDEVTRGSEVFQPLLGTFRQDAGDRMHHQGD